jgi:hypothetical protein
MATTIPKMIDSSIPPFEIAERVLPGKLIGWIYRGLSGTPGKPGASRRYTKGEWVLEVVAHADQKRSARVVTIRTLSEDKIWWAQRAAKAV